MKIELYHIKDPDDYHWLPEVELITMEGDSWKDTKRELKDIYKVPHDKKVEENRLYHKLNDISRSIEQLRKDINDTKRKKSSFMKTVNQLGLTNGINDNQVIKDLNKKIGDIGHNIHKLNMKNIEVQSELNNINDELNDISLGGSIELDFDDYLSTKSGSNWAYHYLLGHGWKLAKSDTIRINENWEED